LPANQPQDLHTEFANALNAGNLDALVSLYEDDASLIAGPTGVAQGVAAIREALSEFLAMKPHIDLHTVSVLQGASDLALLEGRWTLRGTGADGSPVAMAGATREVARRHADGTWLYVLDDPGTGR
jgi:uncharacterized protein (TIGR02246 family)